MDNGELFYQIYAFKKEIYKVKIAFTSTYL